MGKKTIAIFVSLVLMLSCVGVVPIGAEEANVVKIGVFSDTHNHADGIASVLNNIYELSDNGKDLDGVVMDGDIIYIDSGETPSANHYATLLANEKYQEMKAAGKLVYSMGNHEFPLNSQDDATLSAQAIAMFEEQTGFDQNSDIVLGGYHFITAGPSNYSNVMHDYEEYMMERIDAALEEDPEKPVFLIVHQPIAGTVRDAETPNENKYSYAFKEYLDNQPRVIVMTGHTHQAETDPRSIRQEIGGCTYVQTGHITGGSNHSDGYATVKHSKKVSQAIMLEINSDTNVVTLKRFYVDEAGPQYLEAEDWVIDIPAMIKAKATATTSDDLAAYKYTMDRQNQSVAPVFAAGSTVTTSAVAAESVQISFPAANQGEPSENSLVKYYEISVYDIDSAQLIRTDKILSDYFLKESERRSTFEYPVTGLTQGTNYRIDVCATTPYFKKSAPISSVEFVTLEEESFESVTLDSANTFTISSDDCVATPSTYKRNGYIQVPNTASTHTYKFTTTINKSGMYRFMTSEIGSVGAPTKMVIAKEDGSIIKTSERYIATGGVTTYEKNVPYADLPLTPGVYTITWSRGNTGDTVTLMGVKVGKFDELPAEYLDEYVLEKNIAESTASSETIEGTPESIVLNKDGYVTWQVSPSYTGNFKLTYDQSAAGTTTVTSEDFAISGDIVSLPVDSSTSGEIELQLLKGVKYNFTFKASETTTLGGMKLVWSEDFTDLENDIYKFTYNVDTSLAYGNINAAYNAVPVYLEKKITVPYDANYTFSINAGLAATGNVHAYIGRASGGTVSVEGTGSVDTISNRIIFENVPLKAGTSYKVTLFNGKSGSTIKIQDLVFETTGAYFPEVDKLTFLVSDYNSIGSGIASSISKKHAQALIDDKALTYKLKPGAGTYKVYAYTKKYTESPDIPKITMSVDGTAIKTLSKSTWGSSVTKQELGTIRVSDDEFTLKISIPNTSSISRIWFYRFELEAIEEPVVTMYSGTTPVESNIITSLGTETAITAKAFLPKDANGKTVTMLFAIYKGNVLYRISNYEVSGKKNTVTAVTLDELELTAGENYSTKVFFISGMDTLIPLYALPASGMIKTATAE